jgi:hypothetical protein
MHLANWRSLQGGKAKNDVLIVVYSGANCNSNLWCFFSECPFFHYHSHLYDRRILFRSSKHTSIACFQALSLVIYITVEVRSY